MAPYFIQIKYLRQLFLLVLPLLLAGCISALPSPGGVSIPQPIPTPVVRAPQVGQEWVYQIRNVFNQEIVDTVTERVVAVGPEIRIARTSAKVGSLPEEIQVPWGFVLQDPHWKPPQRFEKALPLWPEQFQAGWNAFYKTQYQVIGYPDSRYYWGLSMNAIGWEKIASPVGQVLTFHYQNEIPYFQSNDVFRVQNIREEEIWFSPEIGRWVYRRGFGRYITPGVYWANAYWEDYWQWELISWK